jgi:hypothetical protein
MNSVPIAERLALLDELQTASMRPRRGGISPLITRTNHHADFIDAGGQHLFDDDLQRGLGSSVAIDECLER